jgi:hypothetical protein
VKKGGGIYAFHTFQVGIAGGKSQKKLRFSGLNITQLNPFRNQGNPSTLLLTMARKKEFFSGSQNSCKRIPISSNSILHSLGWG